MLSSMKKFCINLDKATDRWERMQERFKKYQLDDVIRWKASTPDDLVSNNFHFQKGMFSLLQGQ